MSLHERVAKLERNQPTISHAEFGAAMGALEERALARFHGETELPPDPPEWLGLELARRGVGPADIADAEAKIAVLRERKAAEAKVV